MNILRDKETLRKWDHTIVDTLIAAYYVVPFVAYVFQLHRHLALWYWVYILPSYAGFCASYLISWVVLRRKRVFGRVRFASLFLAFNLLVSYWMPEAARVWSIKIFLGSVFVSFLLWYGIQRKKGDSNRPVR
jgi:hypothetical protein